MDPNACFKNTIFKFCLQCLREFRFQPHYRGLEEVKIPRRPSQAASFSSPNKVVLQKCLLPDMFLIPSRHSDVSVEDHRSPSSTVPLLQNIDPPAGLFSYYRTQVPQSDCPPITERRSPSRTVHFYFSFCLLKLTRMKYRGLDLSFHRINISLTQPESWYLANMSLYVLLCEHVRQTCN